MCLLKAEYCKKKKKNNYPNDIVEIAEPCETKDFVADDNCFFRVIAYAVSEREHQKSEANYSNAHPAE